MSPLNKQRHEEGDSRRRRDQIGEKGDKRRREDRSNKRHHSVATENNTSSILSGALATGSLIGIILILVDDISIVGIANDVEIIPMIEVFIDSMKNIIR